jgi:hypothetical protein
MTNKTLFGVYGEVCSKKDLTEPALSEMSAFRRAEGPMETERITLSQRERDRLKVLHEVQQKHLTQIAAAERLRVTDRQVRRILLGLRERGDRCLVHGLRGRP